MAVTGAKLTANLQERARALGFDVCRITSADLPAQAGSNLQTFTDADYHGTMDWLRTTSNRRKSPKSMWLDAKTAIMLGMNYGPDRDPLENLKHPDKATISVYARNRDYHDIIKGKLKTLAGWMVSRTKCDVKVFVDTAPLMEKPLAQKAGVGWQGKHTNLVSREFGSWLFLGAILTTAALETHETEVDHCGSCRACLDVCPTDAFPAPYQLDARKCISYLTIEHDGLIPKTLRPKMGNRIYGCDDCLAVCPWNKYAQQTTEAKLVARDDFNQPDLDALAKLDDAAFRKKFSGSPIKRIGRDKFTRNVLIAIGNSEDTDLKSSAATHLSDPNTIVRGTAVWALSRLEDRAVFADMRETALRDETDASVIQEWNPDGS